MALPHFQSCKKVVARGRAAGLWINVSIKEASPAPDFRACWTIFGCRNCHIIWLWHRCLCHRTSLWQHVFATAPLLWQQTLRSREKALPQKWVVAFFCHSISHVAQFVARGPPCGNVVLPQILPLATWFSRRVISSSALGHAAIFENGLSLLEARVIVPHLFCGKLFRSKFSQQLFGG